MKFYENRLLHTEPEKPDGPYEKRWKEAWTGVGEATANALTSLLEKMAGDGMPDEPPAPSGEFATKHPVPDKATYFSLPGVEKNDVSYYTYVMDQYYKAYRDAYNQSSAGHAALKGELAKAKGSIEISRSTRAALKGALKEKNREIVAIESQNARDTLFTEYDTEDDDNSDLGDPVTGSTIKDLNAEAEKHHKDLGENAGVPKFKLTKEALEAYNRGVADSQKLDVDASRNVVPTEHLLTSEFMDSLEERLDQLKDEMDDNKEYMKAAEARREYIKAKK